MDPISQAALGAAVAHGCFHRKLGWQAAVWGAAAGAAPDLDILFGIGGDPFDALVSHRGITHSLFFAPVIGPLWGLLLERRALRRGAPPDRGRLAAWMGAMTLALLSHPILDWTTAYGTQLLRPFSDARFAWPVMPIIDPVYTLLLLIGLLIAWRTSPRAIAGAASLGGLVLSTAYIAWAEHLNESARAFAAADLARRGIHDAHVSAYATMMQIHYRRVVARTADEDFAGYVSMWDPCGIDWGRAPRGDGPMIAALAETREGRIFEWFAMGMVNAHVIAEGDRAVVRLADLRYGIEIDPRHSLFALEAIFDATGELIESRLRNSAVTDGRSRFDGLLDSAFRICRG
jgi:inner membrane protein